MTYNVSVVASIFFWSSLLGWASILFYDLLARFAGTGEWGHGGSSKKKKRNMQLDNQDPWKVRKENEGQDYPMRGPL